MSLREILRIFYFSILISFSRFNACMIWNSVIVISIFFLTSFLIWWKKKLYNGTFVSFLINLIFSDSVMISTLLRRLNGETRLILFLNRFLKRVLKMKVAYSFVSVIVFNDRPEHLFGHVIQWRHSVYSNEGRRVFHGAKKIASYINDMRFMSITCH